MCLIGKKEVKCLFRIGICDDHIKDMAMIKSLANQFSKKYSKFPIQLHTFQSPYDLLDDVTKNGGYDLYLLDILMPHMTGMQLAEWIRKRSKRAEILFLTSSREYGVEAFGVKASGYLVKPIKQSDFDEAILFCLEKLASEKHSILMVKVKGGIRKIWLSELMMIESFNHLRVLTLADGTTVETSTTLSKLFEQLQKYPEFYMPHRAYIVNMDYVNGLKSTELLLSGERRIPISRGGYSRFKVAYFDYLTSQNFRS